MAMVQMTLYDALSKKKIYEDRLKKFNINTKVFFGSYTNADPRVGGVDLEQAGRVLQSNFDSFRALKANLYALRAAIYEANISHTVTIPEVSDEPITLAEAISRYQSMDQDLAFVNAIRLQKDDILKKIETENTQKLSAETIYREVSKLMTDSKKKDGEAEEFNKAAEEYRKQYTRHLFDPNKLIETGWVDAELEKLQNLKDTFHSKLVQADVSVVLEVELSE